MTQVLSLIGLCAVIWTGIALINRLAVALGIEPHVRLLALMTALAVLGFVLTGWISLFAVALLCAVLNAAEIRALMRGIPRDLLSGRRP